MDKRLTSLLLPALFFMGSAAAQQMFKSVGPDGKVTYSDRPPDNATKISVLKSSTLRPLEGAAPASLNNAALAAAKTAPHGEDHPAARKAKEGTAVASADASSQMSKSVPLEVEKAVVGVMVLADLLRRSEELCSGTLPTSMKRYDGGLTKWKSRNASFLEKQQHILMEVIQPVRRAALQSIVSSTNEESLSKVRAASPAARIKWCDKGFDDIDAGKQDIANNPALSVPLITFKPG